MPMPKKKVSHRSEPPAEHRVESLKSSKIKESTTSPKIVYDTALIREFQSVPATARIESEWYGPWDSLLHRLFPSEQGYQIAPQHQLTNIHGASEWSVYFHVKHHTQTIACVVDIKPPFHYSSPKLRIKVYKQMEDRLEISLEDYLAEDVSAIYGLSCIGTRFMIMKLNTQTEVISPRLNEDPAERLTNVAPKLWWSHQVLTKQGCMHLNRLVDNVKKSLNTKYELVTNPVPIESLPDNQSDVEVSTDDDMEDNEAY